MGGIEGHNTYLWPLSPPAREATIGRKDADGEMYVSIH